MVISWKCPNNFVSDRLSRGHNQEQKSTVASQWYYLTDEEPQGPVSAEQLKKLAAAGQLAPDDMVWKEGMDDWVDASKLKGLFPTSKPAAASPKAPAPAPPAKGPSPAPTPAPKAAPPPARTPAPAPSRAPSPAPAPAPSNPFADLGQDDLFGGPAMPNAGTQPAMAPGPQQGTAFGAGAPGQTPLGQPQAQPMMQSSMGNPYASSAARPKRPFRPKVPTHIWAIFLSMAAILMILSFLSPWWGLRLYRPTAEEIEAMQEEAREKFEEAADEMRERMDAAQNLTPEELERKRKEWEEEAKKNAEKNRAWRRFYRKYKVGPEDKSFKRGELEEGESKIWLVWGWQTGSGLLALVLGLLVLPAAVVFGFVKPLRPWSWLPFLLSVVAGVAMIVVFPSWFFSINIPDENMAPMLRQGIIAGPWMALLSGLAVSVCGAAGGIMGLVAFIKR